MDNPPNADLSKGELRYIYGSLSHAVRYDIIKYLGQFHRPVNYTEMISWLNINPGSFYFHIKKMANIIEQDSEKRFFLNENGKIAYDIIQSEIKFDKKAENLDEEKVPLRFKTILFGELLRNRIRFDNKFIFLTVMISILELLTLELSKLGTIPFFFDASFYVSGFVVIVSEWILSILLIWIILELLSRFFSPIKNFSKELLLTIPLSLLPTYLYPILIIISEMLNISALTSPAISVPFLFVLQILSGIILIQFLQIIKSLEFDKALIPVFIILYVSAGLSQVLYQLIYL